MRAATEDRVERWMGAAVVGGPSDTAVLQLRLARALARIELLEEELRRLREEMAPDAELGRSLGLSRTEGDFFAAIAARSPRVLTREAAIACLYGLADRAPDGKVFDVMLLKIRRKLCPHGVAIETVVGSGWRLGAEGRARLDQMAIDGGRGS